MRTQTQKTQGSAKAEPVSSQQSSTPQYSHPVLKLQQQIGNQAVQRLLHSGHIQAKLTIGQPDDKYEQEADRVADQVMRMPDPAIQREIKDLDEDELEQGKIQTKLLAATITPIIQRLCPGREEVLRRQPTEEIEKDEEDEEKKRLQAKEMPGQTPDVSNELEGTINSLRGGGQPLSSSVRDYMEKRFGRDFSQVRVHTNTQAGSLARSINARAFTLGKDIVFGKGQYSSGTGEDRRLLAHELTHVVQQGAARDMGFSTHTFHPATSVAQRQYSHYPQHNPMDDPRMHKKVAPKAVSCAPPSWCPKHFCQPYKSESYARHMRTKMMLGLMAGIALFVDSRVVPLWRKHLLGGCSTMDLSSTFGKDFTNSKTTKKATTYLLGELKKSLKAKPPTFLPTMGYAFLSLSSLIAHAIKNLGDATSSERMNFKYPKEVAGNIAGDIGKDQLSCKAGAKPSPFNDDRTAWGYALVIPLASGDLKVLPTIIYKVKDTIDLCPGNCGTKYEQLATVAISQFEATGISGDVPFSVTFAHTLNPFIVSPTATTSTPKKQP